MFLSRKKPSYFYENTGKLNSYPILIFPTLGRGCKSGSTSNIPMNRSSVQGAFIRAKKKANINKRGVSIHTLRHSYATHLLEAGVNIMVIQRYMGHRMLRNNHEVSSSN